MSVTEKVLQVDIAEVQLQLLRLIDLAIAGKEIIITVNNQPMVKLMSFSRQTSLFGSDKGKVVMSDDFDAPYLP